jgi:hypothetical protein
MQGAIPPLDRPFERYELPDRDLAVLQGWGAERNRKLGQDGGRKRARKGKKEEDSAEDDDDAVGDTISTQNLPFADSSFVQTSSALVQAADMHPTAPGFERVNTTTSDGITTFVPPPTAPVDIAFNAYSTGGTGPGSHPSAPGVTPDNMGASISPVDNTNFSVRMLDNSNTQTVASYHSQQGGIFGLLNESRPAPSPNSVAVIQVNMSDQLGSQDPRPNIVKRGMIPNNEALGLVG